jgi:type I restriction enzyme S subunit
VSFDELKLSEADIEIIDGDRGVNYPKQNEFYDIGYCLFLNAKNVTKDGFDFNEKSFISREKDNLLRKGKLVRNDIVLTTRGTVGNVAFYNNRVPFNNIRINSGMVILRAKQSEYLPEFVYWMFRSNYIQDQINALKTGSAQPQLPITIMRTIKVLKPKLCEQKVIAATLSALDDMIELNNQINKTLEEMAQAIFKSWFVDFEPFKEGEFEESDLGLIPKGWRVAALDEIADYLNGLAMQKYPPSKNERGLPVLKIKELRQGFTDGNSDICSESIDNSYIINDGDIIFSWSGSLLVDIWCGGRCGLNQHLFKVTSASYNKWFYYMWTRYHLERFIAIAKDKATTMGHIQRKHLSEAKVLIPEPNTLAFMDSVMQPIIDLVIANKVENKTLSTIRDTLLPKLMSGEIRVPVEEVV